MKFLIPLVAALQHIIDTGDRILSSLEKPVKGLHLRQGDRLNKKLNHSMFQETMVRESSRFNYNSVLLHQR